jgi:hypothetical protein
VAGMEKDLHLAVGSRYTIALVVFFIPCFLFEVVSNVSTVLNHGLTCENSSRPILFFVGLGPRVGLHSSLSLGAQSCWVRYWVSKYFNANFEH